MSPKKSIVWRLTILMILVSLACSLPGSLSPTPAPTPTAPAMPSTPLPPAVIETSPATGSQIGLKGQVTIYFNQAMDRTSVEAALSAQPEGTSGNLEWKDDSTLVFTPTQNLPAASAYSLHLADSARAANGLALPAPVSLDFTTADYLRPTQFLPKADSKDVIPNAAIVAAFNQPVVPLGADPASLPAAFSLQPAAQGKGEWLNTSTYIFYPEPALSGGQTYTASLNPQLTANSGSPLAPSEIQTSWSFATVLPAIAAIDPTPDQRLGLDPQIKLTFNQPMDQASLQSGLQFTGPAGLLGGKFTWSEDGMSVTFQPSIQLARNTNYVLSLNGQQVRGAGGTPLGQDRNFSFTTFANIAVTGSDPGQGQTKARYNSVEIYFSAPVQKDELDKYVSISPQVLNSSPYLNDDGTTILLGGIFDPSTDYTLTVSGALQDRWGQALGSPFTLKFRTPPATPSLTLPYFGASMFFVRPEQPVLNAQATNLPRADLTVAPLPLNDFFSITGQNSYDARQAYTPRNALTIYQTLQLTSNQAQPVALSLTGNSQPLPTGVYYVKVDAQQLEFHRSDPYFVVSSDINLTFKAGIKDALVWAVDLRSGDPVANAPVAIYGNDGRLLISGQTDAQGLWQTSIPERSDPYEPLYAVTGQPGQANFSLAMPTWDSGIAPWDFDLSGQVQPPYIDVYLYSDRPIYRPGQTVYFRGIVRQVFNGRYSLPQQSSVNLKLYNGDGQELQSFSLPLSSYGTIHSQYTLPADAPPGYYSITDKETKTYFSFQVADYRKPEINLSVEVSPDQIQTGQTAQATVDARYFFDAPAGNLPVSWTLYARSAYFELPQYQVGPVNTNWMLPYSIRFGDSFGQQIAQGEGRTGPDGKLTIQLPDLNKFDALQRLTLEITAQDESGAPLSARTSFLVHPTDFYVGLRPDQWVGQAGTPLGFEVLSVDWKQKPLSGKALVAEFSQVTWERKDPPPADTYSPPTFEPVYTPVSSTNLVTGPDGKARLSFTPPQAGTYILDVSGGGAKTQILLWVGGKSQAVWPNLPNQHLELTADRESYQPGQTAQIFIPNPLSGNTQALVTVERGVIFTAQVIDLGPSGTTFSLPLTSEEAPNVYVSATLIGADNNFRQGFIELPVAPQAQTLKVELTSQPTRSEPGGEVLFNLRVTDDQGKPVQGEFSLSVVDLAALALADPNAPDIVPAFYGPQPLGIETGVSLAAYSGRLLFQPGGIGGGGGGGVPPTVVRENFPDTAYWNPTLVTDADGRGQVTLTLPDNLTTWQVDVRGLTADTRVGQAESQVVTSKPLLVRPVTPRFLVLGDHVEMAAVVHNNTSNDLQATVSLQALGFLLDDASQLTQTIDIPAGGRTRVAWWGTAQEAQAAELIFSAKAGDLQDASRPVWGSLPILRYTAPQAFVTAGTLPEAGSRQELVSIPRSFVPQGGGLSLELSPSLAATILSSLDAMKAPPALCSSEALVSYLLSNLESYQALETAGLDTPELKSRLQSAVQDAITRLLQRQNQDGGWGWWTRGKSDPYLSAYALFGLQQAQANNFTVNPAVLQKAREYLTSGRPYLGGATLSQDDLSDLALIEFVLGVSGGAESQAVEALYEARDKLAPWGQAMLALTLESLNPSDTRSQDLLGALETGAIRSASGAHWESQSISWFKPDTALFNTAVVVYALAQRDPASPLLTDAVRYLVTQRDAAGLWGSSFDSAWIILALTKAMQGSGELQANYSFSASLNGAPIASGDASGPQSLTTITTQVPLASLGTLQPNDLTISRQAGNGKLYYRAALQVNRPVESVTPLTQGMQISRIYFDGACKKDCTPVDSLNFTAGAKLTAQLTLILPHDSYYVLVEDHIPSGTEILDQSLKTSQQGEEATSAEIYAPDNPFAKGWGWWLFGNPAIYDDHILWAADYLPAGTYVLTYTLIPTQAGQFRVLPAHAWQSFFPEVQGTSAGAIFEIKP